MRRITLQPFRRFAFLALAAHILAGGALGWWLVHRTPALPVTRDSLVWMAPTDFTAATSPALPASAVPMVPEEAVRPKIEPLQSEPAPKPRPLSERDASIRSMLAVAGTQPLAPAPPDSETPVKLLPKAIAIDPAQALALMNAQQAPAPEAPRAAPPAQISPASPPLPAPAVPPVSAPKAAVATPPQPPSAPGPPPVPPPPPQPAQVYDVSRFITVSARSSTARAGDKSVRLEEVDRAIRDAFMRQWMPPKTETLNIDQRTAQMDMTLNRDGHVLAFKIVRLSGSENFDRSLREAASRLEKIPATLPGSYPQDRYEFQLQFHVE
ncbi:MAG: TonB terminal [Verrucomicrobiaceae bacterium]|nr:TonB terminal [Verrucomicrobiaceae bacterium]